MMKCTNKLVLGVELQGNKKIKLILYHLDKRFLSTDRNFKYYHGKNNFFLYSRDKFFLLDNCIRFPNDENYKRGVFIEKTFLNNEKRYEYLKKLYKTLNSWNDDFSDFIKSDDYSTKKEKVKFQGKYWIL